MKTLIYFMSIISNFFVISLFAQPANDDCANAIMIQLGVPVAADNTGATADDIPLVGGSCGDYQVNDASDPGVFFSFVAPAGPVNIIYMGASDARLVLLSGTCDTELFCVATVFQTGGSTVIANQILNPGETYLVVIDPLAGGEGMFMVETCISALVCNDLTVYLDDAGVETISPLDLAMANCDMTEIVASQTAFDCADVAASPISVTVTQGLTSCESLVTVLDTVSPTALCQDVTVQLDEEGNGSIGGTNPTAVTQVTGMLDGTDPTFNRPVGGPGTCTPSGVGTNVFYETFNFTISAADMYTFAFSGPADLTAALYGGGFNPALPCANILAYNDDGNGNLDPLIIIQLNLVPGDYTMVTSTFSNGETGAYTMDISSTNGGQVLATSAVVNSAPVTQVTGMLDGTDPTFNRPVGGPGTCTPSGVGTNVFYETFSFTISAADMYTFAFSGPADLTAALYGGGFNPALPCANILAYNDDGNGNLDPLIIIQLNLVPGDYTMVTSTFSNGETGAYTMDISSTNGGQVFTAGASGVPLIDNGSTDACGIATYLVSQADFTCDDLGLNMVTLSVTDVNGNSSSCTSIITVIRELPCGWTAPPDGINCIDGSSVSHDLINNVFSVTSTNCYYANPFNSDATAFAQHSLCGDGSITAQVTGISGTSLGWAGVTMRESNAPGAKKAQLTTNMAGNQSRREFRVSTNGTAFPQSFPSQNRFWLRIVRSGNQFTLFNSPNGMQWYPVGSQTIAMGSCIQMGLVATNYSPNSTVTATFANVSLTGNGPAPTSEMPGIGIVSSNEQYQPDFSVYPNPTSGELNIDLKEYIGKNVQIELYSLEGKLMQLIQLDEVLQNTQTMLMDRYTNGMYFVKLKAAGLPDVTKRVVLSKE